MDFVFHQVLNLAKKKTIMSFYEKPEPVRMSFESYRRKFTSELPWDSNLEDIFQSFVGMLVSAGWNQTIVESHLIELAEELKEYRDLEKESE